MDQELCYILILHQTTTGTSMWHRTWGCVIFLFHIKPQPWNAKNRTFKVVLYSYSTSNHNYYLAHWLPQNVVLYLIPHQTTTEFVYLFGDSVLCYILILHQTTTNLAGHIAVKKLCYILIPHQTTTSGGLSVDNALFMRQIGCPKMCLRDPKKRKWCDFIDPVCKCIKKNPIVEACRAFSFRPCPRNCESRRIACPWCSACWCTLTAASICVPFWYVPSYSPWMRNVVHKPSTASW